jgi:phosphotransferase system HPr (HPr) family protein
MPAVRRVVTLVNSQGLHARPVAAMLEVARRHRARLSVRCGEARADGRSMLQMLTLAAPGGSQLELEVDGDDAEQLLGALETLIAGKFGEE